MRDVNNRKYENMICERLINGDYYHIYDYGCNRKNLFLEQEDYEYFLELYDRYITPVAETLAWVLLPNHFHLLVKVKKSLVYKYSVTGLSPDKTKYKVRLNTVTNGFASLPENMPEAKKINGHDLGEKQQFFPKINGHESHTCFKDTMWFEDHKWETINRSDCKFQFLLAGKVKKPVPHRHFAHLFNAYARYFNKQTGGTDNLFERPFKRKNIRNERFLEQVIRYIHNNPGQHGFCSHPSDYPWSGFTTWFSEEPGRLKHEDLTCRFTGVNNFRQLKPAEIEEIEKWLELDKADYATELNISLNADSPDSYGDTDAVPDFTGTGRFEDEKAGADLTVPVANGIGMGRVPGNAKKNIPFRIPRKLGENVRK